VAEELKNQYCQGSDWLKISSRVAVLSNHRVDVWLHELCKVPLLTWKQSFGCTCIYTSTFLMLLKQNEKLWHSFLKQKNPASGFMVV